MCDLGVCPNCCVLKCSSDAWLNCDILRSDLGPCLDPSPLIVQVKLQCCVISCRTGASHLRTSFTAATPKNSLFLHHPDTRHLKHHIKSVELISIFKHLTLKMKKVFVSPHNKTTCITHGWEGTGLFAHPPHKIAPPAQSHLSSGAHQNVLSLPLLRGSMVGEDKIKILCVEVKAV